MKTEQKNIFLDGEGDLWFARNKSKLSQLSFEDDSINVVLEEYGIRPERVLEIGCSSGYRLSSICNKTGAEGYGIDPSSAAIEEGKASYPGLNLRVGTADYIEYEDGFFDLIIFGFCLYLCDRRDLFKIAWEADRLLREKSWLVIRDFMVPFPYKNEYVHQKGIYSYKMDYSKMFTWNPCYQLISMRTESEVCWEDEVGYDGRTSTLLLRKNGNI